MSKKVNSKIIKNKEKTSKKIFDDFLCFFKNVFSKKITIYILIGVFVFLFALLLLFIFSNKTVITVDDVKYTEKDFNMYAYLVKIQQLETSDISKEDLKVQMQGYDNYTVGDYLKDCTINRIKMNGAINRIAAQYSISLDDSDYDNLKNDKLEFINSLGSYNNFKNFLRNNHTDEKSYDKALEMSALYEKIFNSLYAEGKLNDLTKEELSKYVSNYYNEYVKLYQIIILKMDLETGKGYTPEQILEKQNFADELLNTIKTGSNSKKFINYVREYSEGYNGEEPEYYLISNLEPEIKAEVTRINAGDISSVISSQYAFHIIKKETLDDGMMSLYLDDKRQEKFAIDINIYLGELKIVNSDYLEKVTIK